MFPFIGQYKSKLLVIKAALPQLGKFFLGLALADSYIDMVDAFVRGANRSQEVLRVSELADMMLEHFQLYPLEHINTHKLEVWNEDFVGNSSHLRAWQEAGYPLDRTSENYEERLKVWKAIWHEEEIEMVVIRRRKDGTTYEQDWSYIPHHPEPPHSIPTYESVIAARNENYGSLVRYVPFWLPLNYGTSDAGVDEGYPAFEGIHFVSIGQQNIREHTRKYIRLMNSFLGELLQTDEIVNVVEEAERWIKGKTTYAETHDIDTFSIARQLAYQ